MHKGDLYLDGTDWKILAELQRDARTSLTDIGLKVGLSSPAVRERIRKMEQAGVILKYAAVVSPEAVGRPVRALVSLKTKHEWPENYVPDFLDKIPNVMRYWGVTGRDEDYFIELVAPSVSRLEALLKRISELGLIATFLVLSYSGDDYIFNKEP